VLEAFRRGEFDQIEIIGQADEKEFFELCFREKLLAGLAETMPTARKKEDVPPWIILAAHLSLKLHLENAFHALERVVRCGGLLQALPPEIASKHLDPKSKQIVLDCRGFNQKNHYPRTTPFDQDTLRKFVRDVSAPQWLDWYNGPVQRVFQRYGFFDPAGVFIGDATYVFVPDNPAYVGSVVMWFDEHNHPVEYDKLRAEERKRAHRERCYKLVTLLHLRGPCCVYGALSLHPGNAHECPLLYRLVENFVQQVGRGVLKLLLIDRGFVDGPNITRCKREWGCDVLLPMKRRMDIWDDAWALSQETPWLTRTVPPPSPKPVPADRPEVLVRREAKRQKTLAARKAEAPAPDPASVLQRTELCSIQGLTSWTDCAVPIQALLLRETYADGHEQEWGLMSTAEEVAPGQFKDEYDWRTRVEEGYRLLKCFYELTHFFSQDLDVITAQVVFIFLSYTLRQWQLWKQAQTQLAGQTSDAIRRQLGRHNEHVVIYHEHAYAEMPLVSFSRELLELGSEARARALIKLCKLEQSLLSPLPNVRAPP
jgi:hypothetical protein